MTGGRSAVAADSAALGIDARSCHAGGGAIAGSRGGERGGRYRLLSVVQRLMLATGRPPDRQERVCRCHFSRKAATVPVRLDRATGRASYGGLETCSSVWACPVCNGRITE